MKRFFLFAVLATGCMLTACVKTEIVDMASNFNPLEIESSGVEVTDAGITSYVVSNGRTYEVMLDNVVHQEQEKTDTLAVSFAKLKEAYLLSPAWQGELVTENLGRGIEKTKTLYRIRAKIDGIQEKIPFYFIQETASIDGYSMPYPELNFELKGISEEELPDIKVTEGEEYYVSRLTFACEVQYEGMVVPLTTDIIAVQRKIPITFDPSVDDWENGGNVDIDL